MDRREFIDNMRIALAGQVNQNVIDENVRYYEDYISMEIKKGKTEEEVLENLGNPRLIAKTIIETNKISGSETSSAYKEVDGSDTDDEVHREKPHFFKVSGWIFVVVFILLIFFGFRLAASVLSFLAPILLPLCIVLMIFSWLKRR